MKIQQREILFAGVTGLAAAAAVFAMSYLVASPKLLFGRSLSAIAPSLFPYITLVLIFSLSVALILLSWISVMRTPAEQSGNGVQLETFVENNNEIPEDNSAWLKVGAFFILLTAYGLLLKPVGFLLSSIFVIGAISLMLGNRNWLQIILLSVLAPVGLYIIATRAMLVSLPELNAIELLYAQGINWVSGYLPQ